MATPNRLRPAARRTTGRLPTADQERIDDGRAELVAELDSARNLCAQLDSLSDSVDSGEVGVVLEPVEEEDTLVHHVRNVRTAVAQ